jgi:hypothetical protein
MDTYFVELRRFSRCIEIARALLDKPVGRHKHVTVLLKGTRGVAIGFNNVKSQRVRFGDGYFEYPHGGVHSEADAVGNLRDLSICRRLTLVNVRLNRKGRICMSKPCAVCQGWIGKLGFHAVYYTNDSGFCRLY